ncbi:MAG TPA: hypothetical protein EYH03_05015 [Chromatiales bacterium]|nr:hypothetical protein [Chromatiales bacterium]
MRWTYYCLTIVMLLSCVPAFAEEAPLEASVAEPFLEMHTGPGRGYPVFHVIERGEELTLIKRRTDWILVETLRGKRGWVQRDALAGVHDAEGRPLYLADADRSDYDKSRWEIGVMGGDLDSARLLTLYGGYRISPNLSAEVSLSQALGNFSTSRMANFDLIAQPFPAWRISPFFALGGGWIETRPRATLVQEEDRLDSAAHVGIGARMYLSRRFFLRAEYRNHKVFTSREENEEISEWKAGFAFFY